MKSARSTCGARRSCAAKCVHRASRDANKQVHDSYAPGLHHLCLRVESEAEVNEVAEMLKDRGLVVTEAVRYPQYAPDYVACFLADPDGVRLEITNYRLERRERHDRWLG